MRDLLLARKQRNLFLRPLMAVGDLAPPPSVSSRALAMPISAVYYRSTVGQLGTDACAELAVKNRDAAHICRRHNH